MAKFNAVGLEEVQGLFMREQTAATNAAPRMVMAGARVLIEAQQRMAERLNISKRSKGALVKSIKADKVKASKSEVSTEVFPHGVDRNHTKKGVRNAEKGFVLEYGRSNMPAKPWMSVANEKCADEVSNVMFDVWQEERGNE